MPEIKIQHVVSCSSADQGNPADNLLKPEGSHKWKTTAPQDKHATVVLQFEKASKIHSIDIGNEGSGFVEVLVGNSSAKTDHDYQVLLVASSFMSPLDSRNGTNRNSVRMFGLDKLSKTAASEKWDRVKIVCTQPFNKTSSYGLSFIKFHSPPAAGEDGEESKVKGAKKLGAFLIRPEKEDDITSGSVFANRGKEEKKETPLTGAAAVRAAARLADDTMPTTSSPKPDPASQKKRKHRVSDEEDEDPDPPVPKPSLKRQSTSLSSTASSLKDEKPPMKKTKSEPPKESPAKAFRKLMEKVVFVLSGFQNPFRGELRDKAMEMGAVYKADWNKTCTHLVCAFANTPKYNQVKGKGKIVTKEWILHSYKQRKRLPWQKYRLGDADSPSESSSEEEEEYIPKKRPSPQKKKTSTSKHDSDEEKPKSSLIKKESAKKVTPKKHQDYDVYAGDTDSGEDTEEEVRRIKAKMSKDNEKSKAENDEVYDKSTDEDEPKSKPAVSKDDDSDSGLPELPDFFSGKYFFLYGDFTVSERRLLTRYITAYDGELENYMSDKTNYVVTYSKWDDNFDEALSDRPSLVFVKPKWIYTCHQKDKLSPYQPYVVVPD